ncbi:hypothetical protein EYF80_041891 [Liparis tanakae]|uniref:Secreted protein n=1 Tax=Liparis tanakae TaxID=230148 RepID=A0A4Z2G3X5_9TELE|nr:hypothetical protein EYF80_041891 [Liparis tanakae]
MTASQVLCFSCVWMVLNLWWMMPTMRSISRGVTGRVRDCSRSRFITWVVNSVHAWVWGGEGEGGGGGVGKREHTRRRRVKDGNAHCKEAARSECSSELSGDIPPELVAADTAAAAPPPFSGPATPSASSMLSSRTSWGS